MVSTVGINHLDLGHFELLSQLLTFIVTLSFSVHKFLSSTTFLLERNKENLNHVPSVVSDRCNTLVGGLF